MNDLSWNTLQWLNVVDERAARVDSLQGERLVRSEINDVLAANDLGSESQRIQAVSDVLGEVS